MFEEGVVDRPSSPRVHSTKGAIGRGCVPADSLETRAVFVPRMYTYSCLWMCARAHVALTHSRTRSRASGGSCLLHRQRFELAANADATAGAMPAGGWRRGDERMDRRWRRVSAIVILKSLPRPSSAPIPSLKLHLYLGASRFSPLRVVASLTVGLIRVSLDCVVFYLLVNPFIEFIFLLCNISCNMRISDNLICLFKL